jgi:hypothetical protein
MKLFSKRKSRGIGSRDRRPGPRCQCIGSQHSELISAIESVMRGCDFMRVKGYFTSNLVHRSRDGRPGLYRVVRAVTETEHPAAFHGRPAQARRSSAQLDLRPAVWGSEELKLERRERGSSPARSQSKGRCLAWVAAVTSLSSQ